MKHNLFESSQWNELNGISFIFLGIINAELYYISAFYIFIYYAILHFIIYLLSSNCKKLNYSSFDSSHCNESNKLYLILLYHWVVRYISNVNVKCWYIDILLYISLFIAYRNMKLLPFNSSYQDKSNELCFIFLKSLSGEIGNKMYFFKIYNIDFYSVTQSHVWVIKKSNLVI
jgi:hypothetical protein